MSKITSLSFNIEDAVKYGAEEAIMLYNIQYWIRDHKARNSNIRKGRVWTYNSYKGWMKLFPFWSEKQVRRILMSLEAKGAILVGNFHTNNLNRTKWYTTNDSESICTNGQVRSSQISNTHGSYQTGSTSLSNQYPNQTILTSTGRGEGDEEDEEIQEELDKLAELCIPEDEFDVTV